MLQVSAIALLLDTSECFFNLRKIDGELETFIILVITINAQQSYLCTYIFMIVLTPH